MPCDHSHQGWIATNPAQSAYTSGNCTLTVGTLIAHVLAMRIFATILLVGFSAMGCQATVDDADGQASESAIREANVVYETVSGTITRCDASIDRDCRGGYDAVLQTSNDRRALRARNSSFAPTVATLMGPALLGAKVSLELGRTKGEPGPARDLVSKIMTVSGRFELLDEKEGRLGVLHLPSGARLSVKTSPSVQIVAGETTVSGLMTTDADGTDLLDVTHYAVQVPKGEGTSV